MLLEAPLNRRIKCCYAISQILTVSYSKCSTTSWALEEVRTEPKEQRSCTLISVITYSTAEFSFKIRFKRCTSTLEADTEVLPATTAYSRMNQKRRYLKVWHDTGKGYVINNSTANIEYKMNRCTKTRITRWFSVSGKSTTWNCPVKTWILHILLSSTFSTLM